MPFRVSHPFLPLFPQEGEFLYVLFQCLEHARQDVLSRSTVWTVLYHSPDQGRKLSREFLALLSGQEEANHHAGSHATK